MIGSRLDLLLLPLAAASLVALLSRGERRQSLRAIWLFKPLTSALFVLAALSRGPTSRYDWLVVAGLLLSMAGDVSLIRREKTWFLAGLTAFLLGHVAYLFAFGTRAGLSALNPAALAAIGVTSAGTFRYFRPHLDRMLWPVAAYVIVITLMLMGAWAVFAAPGSGDAARWLIAAGATLFYVSDITVARDRFVPGVGFANRAGGLTLYYTAQFLLAFSIGQP
jgi:uncharacterized membrane protein YhhN